MTPNQIDGLEFWEVEDILDYWWEFPPTNELVAGFVGYKAPLRLTAKEIRTTAPPGCLTIEELEKMSHLVKPVIDCR